MKRISVSDISAMKGNEKIVCLTGYTAPFARIIDQHADIILVGDSLGMVLYGMDSTLSVTLDMMIAHGKAVVKSSKKAMVVVDMPFGSYQKSKYSAFENAARVMADTGCSAIKMEGGIEMAPTVEYLQERGIPVMGHVALMPQHVNSYGGYGYRGRTPAEAKKIMQDALAIEKAGAFSIVLEGVLEKVAREITTKVKVPTIGIGASPACDGQVLVSEDMAGLNPQFTPKFVKVYAELAKDFDKAVRDYAADVRGKKFPTSEYCFTGKK